MIDFNFNRYFEQQRLLLEKLGTQFKAEGFANPNYLGTSKTYLSRIVPFTDATGNFTGKGTYGGIIKDFNRFRQSIDTMTSQRFKMKADLDRVAYEYSSITSKDMKKQAEATIQKLKEQFDYVKKLSIQANDVRASNSTGASFVRNLKFDDKSLNPSQRKIISDFLQRTNAKDPFDAITKTYVDNVKYVSKNVVDAGKDFSSTIRSINKSIKEYEGKTSFSKSIMGLTVAQSLPIVDQITDVLSMRERQRGEMYIRMKDYERGFTRLDNATSRKSGIGALTTVGSYAGTGYLVGGAPGALIGTGVGIVKSAVDWYNEAADTENTKREEYITAIETGRKLINDIRKGESTFNYNSKFNAVSKNYIDRDTFSFLENTYNADLKRIPYIQSGIDSAEKNIERLIRKYKPEGEEGTSGLDDFYYSLINAFSNSKTGNLVGRYAEAQKYGLSAKELQFLADESKRLQELKAELDEKRQRTSNFESLRTSVSGKFLNLRLADLDRDFNRSSINIENESTKLGEFGYYTDSSYFDKAETKLLGYISELKSIMDSITGNTAEDITRRNTVSDKLFSAEQNLESLRREKTSYGINIDTNNKAVSRQRETFYLTDLLNKNFPDFQTIRNRMDSYKAEAEKARTEYFSLTEKENKTEDDFKKIQRLAQDLSFSVKAYNDLDAKLKGPVSQIFGGMSSSSFIADQLGSFSRWAGIQDGNSAMIKEIQTTNSFLRTIADILRSEPLGYSTYE